MRVPRQIELLLEMYRIESLSGDTDRTGELESLEEELDPSLRKRYRKVRQTRKTGIALLKDGMCSGCRMVYPETHDITRYRDVVSICEFCGRLILIPGAATQSLISAQARPPAPAGVAGIKAALPTHAGKAEDTGNGSKHLKDAAGAPGERTVGEALRKRPAVLLADTDNDFRSLIKNMFVKSGYDVSDVDNGERALDALSNRPFDLFISEVKMPGLSGTEIMEEIKRKGTDVTVIYLTAHGDVDSYLELMALGAFDYVNKPVRNEEIMRIARQALAERDRRDLPQ